MFYYSGCRISEFRNLKISDINFKKQEFVIFEKKGKRYHEVIKPININVAYLWKEILAKIQKDDEFLFSNGLIPGNTPITEAALSHRYRRWVVKKLGIKVDLYALRHTYLNDITTIYGISKAKDIAGLQCTATCPDKFNLDYFCMVYSKHISRYLSTPEKLQINKI